MPIRDYRQQTRAPGAVDIREGSIARAADSSGAEQLARGIHQVADTLERAKQTRELSEARVAITEGVGAINADLTQDQDFDTMRPRYGERLDALRDAALERVTAPILKTQVAEEFSRARVSTEAHVFRREHEVAGSSARATLARQVRTASNFMPVATPEQAEDTYNTTVAMIDDMVGAGYMTAEQGEAEKAAFERDASTGYVLKAINDDPATAIEKLSDPSTAYGLDEIERQRYLATATSTLEAQNRQTASKLENRVERARKILETGGNVESTDLAALREEVQGTEFGPLLEGSIVARQQLGNFAAATPAEQRQFIDGIAEHGFDLDDEAVEKAFFQSIDAIHANTVRALETDPVKHALDTGITGAGSLDLADPESMEARMALADDLSGQFGAEWRVFTDKEADHYETVLQDGEPDDQLALVVTMAEGFGARAPSAFAELGGLDPVTRRAGQLVMETGDDRAARTILFGRKAMEAGDELRVPSADAMEVFMDELGAVMAEIPAGREDMVATAKAYYAAKAPGRVTVSDVNAQVELLSEGLQAAMGQVKHNGRAYGGIQEINGVPVKLPATLDRRGAQAILDNATDALWTAGSLSGGLPTQGLGDDSEEVVPTDDVVLRWSGVGTYYRVGIQGRRGVEWYSDPASSDGHFYVDLNAMDEAHRRAGRRPPAPATPAQNAATSAPAP